MNWDRVAGEWKQLKSRIQTKWAKLTDDDLSAIGAKKEAFVGKLQERYGILRDEAERQVDEWIAKMPPSHGASPEETKGKSETQSGPQRR